MKLFGREVSTVAKVLVVLVAILLVSAGMCGLQLEFGPNLMDQSSNALFVSGIVELIAMLLSAVGIVVMLLALGARGLYRLSQSEPELELEEGSRDESPAKRHEEQ